MDDLLASLKPGSQTIGTRNIELLDVLSVTTIQRIIVAKASSMCRIWMISVVLYNGISTAERCGLTANLCAIFALSEVIDLEWSSERK